MNNGFTAEKDLSQVSPQTSQPELTPRQNKIYRNLQDIGPEIAAFYLDGVKILRSDNFETAALFVGTYSRVKLMAAYETGSSRRSQKQRYLKQFVIRSYTRR